jgi:Family of unknown function (DUF5675)
MKVLQLTRMDYLQSGIFGTLIDPESTFAVFSLEHAYAVTPDAVSASTDWEPKVPKGSYTCQRGLHQLVGMSHPFETFQLMNVPGHTNILVHPGNHEADSEGCILVGLDRQGDTAVLESRAAFLAFMKNLEGLDQFNLEIS